MKVVGLMSGTSVDGIDTALCEITKDEENIDVKQLDFFNMAYENDLREEIFQCFSNEASSTEKICALNFRLGLAFADAVKKMCAKNALPLSELGLVCSHGQTVYHIPPGASKQASTLQLGEPAVIAYETQTDVVSNFRSMDMAAGGQGAPLVPFTEYILFRDLKLDIALQNIGGISNVTVIPHASFINDVFAFDTGPGNMIIDECVKIFFSKPYDTNGDIAASGTVNREMLNFLMSNSYIHKTPPKTTGRELFGAQFVKELIVKYPNVQPADFVATATMFTAASIAENYKLFVYPKVKIDRVVIGGGGAYNKTLICNLRRLLNPETNNINKRTEVLTFEDIGFSSDAKEAVAFALLGFLLINKVPANVLNATGAKHRMALGSFTPYVRE